MVGRIFDSSNVFLMFSLLDARHVAIITEKEADTERCFWETGTAGILQCHQQSLKNYEVIENHQFRSSMLQ